MASRVRRMRQMFTDARGAIPASWSGALRRKRRTATPGERPRILILTSTLGSGHVSATKAIELALHERMPEVGIHRLDFWSLMDGRVAQTIRHAYLQLVQRYPELYDRLYQLDRDAWGSFLRSARPSTSALSTLFELLKDHDLHAAEPVPGARRHASDRLLLRQLCSSLVLGERTTNANHVLMRTALIKWCWTRLAGRLEASVRAFAPDVIIATQMYPAALAAWSKQRRNHGIPMIGVPTDFGVHDFWVQRGIDCYCLAHQSIANLESLAGARTTITGIPLMPGFERPPSAPEARTKLGLAPDRPVVLVPGGGLGLGVDAAAAKLLDGTADIQVIALVGRGTAAREALTALSARHSARLRILDWSERVELLLRAADVVVGKPGGLTVAETLACGRPLFATRSLRGQEGFNVRFLEKHGVGALLPEEQMVPTIKTLLRCPDRLARLQATAWALGRRDGAARIAEQALLHIARPGRRQRLVEPAATDGA